MPVPDPATAGKAPGLAGGAGKLDILCLAMVVMFDTIAFGILIPILPFLAQSFGASEMEIGSIYALWGLAAFFSGGFWGYLSDRMGRRPMILISIALAALAMLVMAFGNGLWALVIGRAMTGLAAGKFGVVNAYVADITTPDSRVRVNGAIQGALSLGFVFGPVIGGLLTAGGTDIADLQRPMLVAAIANAVAFLLCLFVLKEPQRDRSKSVRRSLWQNLQTLAQTPGSRLPVVVVMATQAMLTSTSLLFPLWGADLLGWGAVENGYNFTWVSLLTAFLQVWALGRLSKRMALPSILLIGMSAYAMMYFIGPFLTTEWVIIASLSLFGIGLAFAQPVVTTILSNNTAADKQGSIQGAAESLKFLAAMAGPITTGFVYETYGYVAAFHVLLGIALIGLAAALLMRFRMQA